MLVPVISSYGFGLVSWDVFGFRGSELEKLQDQCFGLKSKKPETRRCRRHLAEPESND